MKLTLSYLCTEGRNVDPKRFFWPTFNLILSWKSLPYSSPAFWTQHRPFLEDWSLPTCNIDTRNGWWQSKSLGILLPCCSGQELPNQSLRKCYQRCKQTLELWLLMASLNIIEMDIWCLVPPLKQLYYKELIIKSWKELMHPEAKPTPLRKRSPHALFPN